MCVSLHIIPHQLLNETIIGDRFIAKCLLSNEINDYHIVAQGKTVIPGVADDEEMHITNVSPEYYYWLSFNLSCCIIYFISSALSLASLTTETELRKCMCMSDFWLGVYRDDDAMQPNVGISHHKSGEDTDTWSQRCRRVRTDGCKSRTCARSVRLWFRYPWIGPLHQNFWHTRCMLAPCKSSTKEFLHRFLFLYPIPAQAQPHELTISSQVQTQHGQLGLWIDTLCRAFSISGMFLINYVFWPPERCLLSNDIYDYHNVAQGKVTIPSMDDGEECTLTDVSASRVPKFSVDWNSQRMHDPLFYFWLCWTEFVNVVTFLNVIVVESKVLCKLVFEDIWIQRFKDIVCTGSLLETSNVDNSDLSFV